MPVSKHGHSRGYPGRQSKIYSCWMNMRHRCMRPAHPEYPRYGGRGISVCERWADFETFLTDMGEKPNGLSIDRINNDGNYEPSNCRWSTQHEQNENRRDTRKLFYQGRTLTICEWSKVTGIRRMTLYFRVYRGWSVERLLTQRVQLRGKTKAKSYDNAFH